MVDSSDKEYDDDEGALLQECVAAVVHAISTNVPPEIVLPILTPLVASAAGDETSPAARCAAYGLMQSALDGCAQYVAFFTSSALQ